MEPKLIAIAACDRLGVMGKSGTIPWCYEEDVIHFYQTIANYPVIMGYKTYLSLPKKTFKDRLSLVMTQKHRIARPGIVVIPDLQELKNFYMEHPNLCLEPNFVIGGSVIFKLLLQAKLIHSALITHIHDEHAGDTFFPLDALKNVPSQLLKKTDQFSIMHYNLSTLT